MDRFLIFLGHKPFLNCALSELRLILSLSPLHELIRPITFSQVRRYSLKSLLLFFCSR